MPLFSHIPFLLLLLLPHIFISSISTDSPFSTESEKATATATPEMRQAVMEVLPELRPSVFNERRRLRSFQICALCTCCGGPKGLCFASPCCYAINCNIPNRPFGFCSFIPKTCNCFGCHL